MELVADLDVTAGRGPEEGGRGCDGRFGKNVSMSNLFASSKLKIYQVRMKSTKSRACPLVLNSRNHAAVSLPAKTHFNTM